MSNLLEFRVGLLTILALVLFVWLVGKVEDYQPFKHVYRLGVTFYDVQRLVVGDPVRLNGLPVGKVKLMMLKEGLVLVWLEVDEGFMILRKSKFTIGTAGFFGANYIKIKQPLAEDKNPNQYLSTDEVVSGVEEPGLDRLIEEGQQIFASARVTFDAMNKILGDADFRDNIKDSAKNMKGATARAEELMKNIDSRIAEITANLKKMTGNANSMIEENRAKFKQTVDDLDKLLVEFRGTASDNREHLKKMIADIQKFASDLQANGETARKLKNAIANLDQMTLDYGAHGRIGGSLAKTAQNAVVITDDFKAVSGQVRDYATDSENTEKIGRTLDDVHKLRESSDDISALTTKVSFDLPSTTFYDIDRSKFRGDSILQLGYDNHYYGYVGQEDIGNVRGLNVIQLGSRFFDRFIVRSGAFRDGTTNHNGIGVDAELFDKRATLSVEGIHLDDPLIRVIARYRVNDHFDAEVRKEGDNRGLPGSTLVGVQTHF